MKKVLILLFFFILVIGWVYEKRTFLSLQQGRYVTIWEMFNDKCYIIPGRYYGLIKPSDNFIESSRTNNITIFFSKKKADFFIIESEQRVNIKNDGKSKIRLLNYNDDPFFFGKVIYKPDATKHDDLNEDMGLIDLFLREGYGINQNGQRM